MISENPEWFWSTYHLIHIPTENEFFLHSRSVCEALEQARCVYSPISWANHLPMLNPTFIFPLEPFTKNLFALRIDSRQCFSSIFPGESVLPLSFSPSLVTSGRDLSRVKRFRFDTWYKIYFAAAASRCGTFDYLNWMKVTFPVIHRFFLLPRTISHEMWSVTM